MKLIIQSLWTENVGWDDQIPDCLEKRWNNWYQKLNKITSVALSRCIGYDDKNKYIKLFAMPQVSIRSCSIHQTNKFRK